VSKSITPDMDGDAIGGTVEVRSVSAFDRNGTTATLNAQLSQNALRSETSPKVSASATHLINDEVGIAGAVSWQSRDFGSDNIESNGDDEVEQRFYDISRERIGAAINLDFRPDYKNSYYIRTMYNEFTDNEFRLANTFILDGEDSEIEAGTKDREETQTIMSVALGGENISNLWTLNYQLGYAYSNEDEPSALYYTFVTENEGIDADLETQIPSVTMDNSVLDTSTYELDEVSFEKNYAEDTEFSGKIDLTRQFTIGDHIAEFKTGAKLRSREKSTEANISIYDGDFDGISGADFESATPDWGLGTFGPAFSRSDLRADFAANKDNLELAELDSEWLENS
jgi:hypothetical protein